MAAHHHSAAPASRVRRANTDPGAAIVRIPNETAYTIGPLQQIVLGRESGGVSASLKYLGGIPGPVTFRVPQRLAALTLGCQYLL
jgi:hypothetical protein